jgi:EAL domain-containing protein (putative c-di-GMP-specific phosphodiesterase class I)/GGDEF domain-containing protein
MRDERQAGRDFSFSESVQPAWVHDVRTLEFLAVNDAAVRRYGYSRERFLSLTVTAICPHGDLPDPTGVDALSGRGAARHRTADGHDLFVRTAVSDPLSYADREARITIVFDIADVRAQQGHRNATLSTRELARIDPVVGIPNRAALTQTFATTEPVLGAAVFAIRLDIVHQVETSLADAVTRAAAALIRDTLAAECSVFVHSTDVFVALCPSVDSTFMARTCAELLVAAFIPPLPINDGVVVNVSVGADVAAGERRAPAELLEHALTALHRTGRHGARVCLYTPGMQHEAIRADAVDRHLRAAAPAEFSLVYQPVVSLGSRHVIGVEALLRWNSAELGPVSPAEFIPVAERSGFIADLGNRVVNMATADYAGWRLADARRPRLMINVSAHQLRSPVLLAELERAVDRTGISMTDIDLELTETAMIEQLGAGVECLNALRDRGVRICLDDFGMGYSSLNYLAALPLDVVKIDRSFVSGMRQDPIKRAVVHSVIELAHEIGAEVIGEGVEQRSEAERLRRLHCDAIQGYWVARPMPPDVLLSQLAAGF